MVCAGADLGGDLRRHQYAPGAKRRARIQVAMSAHTVHDRRQRRLLIGLALLFLAPLGLAFYLYYGHGAWHPGGHVNAGELITPARPLPALALPLLGEGNTDSNFLKRKWTFLYVEQGRLRRELPPQALRHAADSVGVGSRHGSRAACARRRAGAAAMHASCTTQHPDLIVIRATPAAAPLLALLPDRAAARSRASISSTLSAIS